VGIENPEEFRIVTRAHLEGPLFRPVKNNSTGTLGKPLNLQSLYESIVLHYAKQVGITNDTHGFCVHSLRATAATNSLQNGADIAEVQQWLGHANVSTTRLSVWCTAPLIVV
jgi:integrase/recombinase XerD